MRSQRRKRLARRKCAELTDIKHDLSALKKRRGKLRRHHTMPATEELIKTEAMIKELRMLLGPLRRDINRLLSRPPLPQPVRAWGFFFIKGR